MTTIHYREVTYQGYQEPEIVEENLTIEQFANACGQNQKWILQLLEYDILPARSDNTLYFLNDDVARAQRAYRLQRDFDASLSAVAMMLDLIDEVQKLRRQVKFIH